MPTAAKSRADPPLPNQPDAQTHRSVAAANGYEQEMNAAAQQAMECVGMGQLLCGVVDTKRFLAGHGVLTPEYYMWTRAW